MAISRFSAVAGTAGANFSIDVGAVDNNRFMVVALAEEDPTSPITAVTVGGNSMTQVPISPAENPSGNGTWISMWTIDEAGLDTLSGSQTVAVAGDNSGMGDAAMVFYGVDQTVGIFDSGLDEASTATPWTAILSCAANGAVVGMWAHGDQNFDWTSFTSPLANSVTPVVTSAFSRMNWGIESSAQTDKSYVGAATSASVRGAVIVISLSEYKERRIFIT